MFLTRNLKEITTIIFLIAFVNAMNENIKIQNIYYVIKVFKLKQHVGNVFITKNYIENHSLNVFNTFPQFDGSRKMKL